MRLFYCVLALCYYSLSFSQVGIGTTTPRASLDIETLDRDDPQEDEGLLIPSVNQLAATNPGSDQQGMLIYLTTNLTGVNISGTAQDYDAGFYFWDDAQTNWIPIALDGDRRYWSLSGNTVTTGTDFLGSTNNVDVDFRANNTVVARITTSAQLEMIAPGNSTFIGVQAGENYNNGGGATRDVFVGFHAGRGTVQGRDNVAVGTQALLSNTNGNFNTAIGDRSLIANTDGNGNTAIGKDAMILSNAGDNNTSVGRQSLPNLTNGNDNVAIGRRAGTGVSDGGDNVFIGNDSQGLRNNIRRSTAIGHLVSVTGNDAVALGSQAESLSFRTIAIGRGAQATVADAIAIGTDSRGTQDEAVAVGNLARATDDFSTAIGFNTEASGQNSSAFGNGATVTVDNQIRLGNTNVNRIEGQVNFSATSDKRFKSQVRHDIAGLPFILSLEPVSYIFNKTKLSRFLGETNSQASEARREIGFLAQDVLQSAKETNFDFSGVHIPKNEDNDVYSLQYATFVVPLVKAIQEQQAQIKSMKKQLAALQSVQQELNEIRAILKRE